MEMLMSQSKRVLLNIILCIILTACDNNTPKNISSTVTPTALSHGETSQTKEIPPEIDFNKEKETLQQLKNKFEEKTYYDNVDFPTALKMLHFDKSYTSDGKNYKATIYSNNDENISIIEAHGIVFFIEKEKIYIDTKDDESYLLIEGKVYSLNAENLTIENKQTYFVELLSNIKKANFEKYNVAIGSKSFVSKEYSDETTYSDFI